MGSHFGLQYGNTIQTGCYFKEHSEILLKIVYTTTLVVVERMSIVYLEYESSPAIIFTFPQLDYLLTPVSISYLRS